MTAKRRTARAAIRRLLDRVRKDIIRHGARGDLVGFERAYWLWHTIAGEYPRRKTKKKMVAWARETVKKADRICSSKSRPVLLKLIWWDNARAARKVLRALGAASNSALRGADWLPHAVGQACREMEKLMREKGDAKCEGS